MLALDNPLNDPNGVLEQILYYSDLGFTTIFTIEIISRIIVFGLFFNGKNSYLKHGWNICDFVIILLSLVSLFYTQSKLNSIKVLRLLRVLKPIRIIARNEGLKLAVSALLLAIPHIFNVIMISLLCFIIFGIIGVNYLKGAFYYCYSDETYPANIIADFETIIVTKFDCLNYGGIWLNQDRNYDNIVQSVVSLF